MVSKRAQKVEMACYEKAHDGCSPLGCFHARWHHLCSMQQRREEAGAVNKVFRNGTGRREVGGFPSPSRTEYERRKLTVQDSASSKT